MIEETGGAAGRVAVALSRLIALSTQTMTAVAADPMPGVDVAVERGSPGARVARVTTDDRGCLVFKFLRSGRYQVYDNFGNYAWLEHDGGAAKWRLLGVMSDSKPVWSLAEDCDPCVRTA